MKEVSKTKLISVVIGCFVLMVSSSVVSNSQSYFLTSMRDYLDCTAAQFSLYYSIVQIGTVITCLVIGPVMNKVPRWIYLGVGAVGTLLGFLVLSRVTELWMVYAGAALVGLFQALIVVPPVQILNEWMPKGAGIAMGFVMSATGFGGIIMAQVMPRVVANVSWRTGYLFCAAMWIVCTVIGIVLTKDKSPYMIAMEKEQKAGTAKPKTRFADVAKDPMLWLFLALCFIGNGCATGMYQHLSPLMELKGFDANMIAGAMTIFNISMLVWKISEGGMYEKIGSKRFVLIYGVVGIASYMILLSSGAMLYWGLIVTAFMNAGITVIYVLVCNEYFGVEYGGQVWGFAWAAFQLGATFTSPLFGFFLDTYNSYDFVSYLGAGCNLIIGLAFFFMLRHKRTESVESTAV